MGVDFLLDGKGGIVLGGLKNLTPEQRGTAVKVAREHKPIILAKLRAKTRAVLWHETCPGYWQDCVEVCPHFRINHGFAGPFCLKHGFAVFEETGGPAQ